MIFENLRILGVFEKYLGGVILVVFEVWPNPNQFLPTGHQVEVDLHVRIPPFQREAWQKRFEEEEEFKLKVETLENLNLALGIGPGMH